MTFLEAAIEVLRQAGRPLPLKEITEKAIKLGLLTHQGRTPEATMQARLAGELKKGERTLLVRKSPAVFGLRRYDGPKPKGAEPAKKGRSRRGKKEEAAPVEVDSAPVIPVLVNEEGIDLDAVLPPPPRQVAVKTELPPEDLLAEEYKEELEAPVTPGPSEVVDERSKDEDRPMFEAIQSRDLDRRGGRGRRGRGREERKEKKKEKGKHAQPQPQPQPQRQRQPHPQPQRQAQPQRPPHPAPAPVPAPVPAAAPVPAPVPLPLPVAVAAAEGGLAAVAEKLLRSLADGRPVHVRQLAAMAQKRKLVLAGDGEELARAIKAALLLDVRARAAEGLRPRIRHHGGSLFGLPRLDPALSAAEDALAERARDLRRATIQALRERILRLPPAGFADLVHAYLSHTGATDIDRVKRVDDTTYFQVSRGGQRLLVSARGDGGELGRRNVGELRAGVLAKGVDAGLLCSPAPLGSEAVRALAEPGPPVTVLAGDAFAETLAAAGVGVVPAAMPVFYLDLELFGEMGET